MDSSECSLALEDAPRPEDIATVIDGLVAYNLQKRLVEPAQLGSGSLKL